MAANEASVFADDAFFFRGAGDALGDSGFFVFFIAYLVIIIRNSQVKRNARLSIPRRPGLDSVSIMCERLKEKTKPAILDLPFTVYALFLVRLINAAGSFVIPFITMILTRKLGWGKSAAGNLLTAINLCGMAWTLAAGKLGDRLGRKRLIAASQIAAAALFAICALIGVKPCLPWLIAPVIILLNATWPVFNAVVADVTPENKRKEAFSLIYWGNNVGFAIGPLAAGFLFEKNARLMFAVNSGALLAVSALFIFAIKETAPCGIMPAEGDSARTPEGERSVSGSLFRALARRPLVILFALAMILLNFVYNQHLFSLPIRLDELFAAAGPGIFGKLMSVNALTVVALTLPVTMLFRRLPPLVNMAIASAFYALGFGLMGLASAPIAFYALTALWTVGEIVSATNFAAYVASRAPCSHRARFNSLVICISSIGTILCPMGSGAFMHAWGSGAIWIAVAGVAILGAAAMIALAFADRARPLRAPFAR
jgi:MFS family permease